MTDIKQNKQPLSIDKTLAHRLVVSQFSEWSHLPVTPVARQGWDNRTFHLGKDMLIRMPSDADYALQVEKEQQWLPKLALYLPLAIPAPLAIGQPAEGYPWKWSIYRWLQGEPASVVPIADLCDFAKSLAQFLIALQRVDATGGPLPGPHSFYRGGLLSTYDAETRQALLSLKGEIDVETATEVWDAALATTWSHPPVWVHGDISVGNLLVENGQLSAVIDFGQVTTGDPACDLAIAWTLFKNKSRDIFRASLTLDEGTWARGRGWTLWKALITAARQVDSNSAESAECWRIIDEVLADYKNNK